MKNLFLSILTLTFCLSACSSGKKDPFEITGYDCGALSEVELEKPLQEISGLAYNKQRSEFLAVNDEQGNIYVLDSKTFKIKRKLHFGEKGDYEEIQLADSMIYVLRSDGNIFKMQYHGDSISHISTVDYQGAKAEFESFYILHDKQELALIPKNSKLSFANNETRSQRQHINTGEPVAGNGLTVDWQKLSGASVLHPSAVAIHPLTKQIYMLASIEKILLVVDMQHDVIREYKLPAAIFQQPEGIAFDEDANLYISNEAGGKKPTIIRIPVQKNN